MFRHAIVHRHLAPLLAATLVAAGTTVAQAQQAALTLESAVTEALERSPALRLPTDDLARADIRARLAASQFNLKVAPALSTTTDPMGGTVRTVGVSLARSLQTGGRAYFNATSMQFANPMWGGRDTGYTAGISQPLLGGWHGAETRERDAARHAVVASERRLTAARATLAVRVAGQYLAVCKQQRMADSAARAVSRATTLRVAAEARTRAGLATELDVVRASMLEVQTMTARTEAEGAAAAALDELLILIGRDTRVSAAETAVTEPDLAALADVLSLAPAGVDELAAGAIASRPEIVEARDRVRDARRAADAVRWNMLPPLSLDLSYTARGVGADPGSVFAAMPGGWRVSLNSTHSIDRAAASAAADGARLSVSAAERDVRDLEQRVAIEIRQLYRAWVSAGSMAGIHAATVTLAGRERELADLRCERGLATTLEVIDAHENLRRAENASIAAEFARIVLALDLRRAAGQLDLERIWR